MIDIEEVLGPDGILAKSVEGFAYRPEQEAMAKAVTETIEQGGVLISEAGTGTGKTFAYLVPALVSGQKVIVSTGTKNLQDQLFHRDLPLVRDALAVPADVALLKGRSNYLCIHRMETTLLEGRLRSKEMVGQLMTIKSWSGRTKSGDIAELNDIPEDAQIWPYVTSTTDNCIGQECSDYSTCHLVEARRLAQEADVVVINHHLLCADFALKEEGFGELLPGADCFIVDEAHQLPEVASNFFGVTLSGRQLLELAKDTETEYHREAGDLKEITEKTASLSKTVRDLRLVFGLDLRRGAWKEISADHRIMGTLEKLDGELQGLADLLEAIQGRGKGLDSCLARCQQMQEVLTSIRNDEESDDIRWFETHRQSFRLNRTPLDISGMFQAQMERHPGSWIFTSATLAVGERFDHFQPQLGLASAATARWDSPFDYPNQALWFVPRGMPDPRSGDGYTEAIVEIASEVVKASKGRAFLLFTSHRALRLAADLLESKLDYPLLVQGSAPKAKLLDEFRSLGNAVLLGTASFWEGVDVRGEALSCVVIDKLPFSSPGDPVLQARIDALRKRGGNPFMEFQVPQAVIALKQGVGRLIRDVTDRGVLVICDPRLLKRGYGHTFLDSMPPMARTRDIADVQRFFDDEIADTA
ncbi:ATP-dependent DNA helicase [Solemya velesiana gill symbiont]|uniref:DNA 5'-3' helicase n=1 Tax=Solemya velesiana gill symbiont TaxID=1918948 RepID=A0A1T2KY46_9GAMM|nr:ATP-dependent DNA helicase [Solemya velesiana gill symbiont]OOZ37753.1 helicase [Solemya velesiana gill symbiont]